MTVLRVKDIRRDGGTQCRVAVDAGVVQEYCELMRAGEIFPPIRVWFDGREYWLSDGFHRVEAAIRANIDALNADVHDGMLDDAKLDSFGANQGHGLRRTGADNELVVRRALAHPVASKMSTVQLSKLTGIPATTLRRLRQKLSSPNGEDGVRIGVRNGRTYTIRTGNIGKTSAVRIPSKHRSKFRLEAELAEMKANAVPDVQCVLNIIGKWVLGAAASEDCIRALETLLSRWGRHTGVCIQEPVERHPMIQATDRVTRH